MIVNVKFKISIKHFIIILLISNKLFSQDFVKEIIPFANKEYALTNITTDFLGEDIIFGIGYLFDTRGKQIPNSSFLALLKLNTKSEFEIYWRFDLPKTFQGDFTDFVITDLDNDGSSEIIVTANIYKFNQKPKSIFIFNKQDDILIENLQYFNDDSPKIHNIIDISLSEDSITSNKFFILNDNQATEIFLITITKPSIKLTKLWQQAKSEKYFESKIICLDNKDDKKYYLARVNSDLIYLVNLDNPTFNISIKSIFEPNGNIWDIQNLLVGDFNGDAQDEIIAGLMNGGLNLIRIENDSLYVTEILNSSNQFDRVFSFDLYENGKDDLILSDRTGQFLRSYSYDTKFENFWTSKLIVNSGMNGIKFLNTSSINKNLYFPYIFPEFMHHGILRISKHQTNVKVQNNLDNIQKPINAEKFSFDQIDSMLIKFENIDGKPDKILIPQKHEIIEIANSNKKIEKANFVIAPNSIFSQKINLFSVASKNLNYSINAPEGMKFNLVDHSFVWKPKISQLGLHKISAKFYWDDVEIKKEFSIYVNDKIEIINKLPKRNIIQTGEIFQYQLDVKDLNNDHIIKYSMIKYPQGATINSQGLIFWKPTSNQIDWFDFEIIINDGYSKDYLNFSIFVNYPVHICKTKKINISLGNSLKYKINFLDKNQGAYLTQFENSPKIEDWQHSGIYETLILTNRTKSDLPKIISQLSQNNIKISNYNFQIIEIQFEQNKLILLFNYKGNQIPEFSKVFTTFFNYINYKIPNHTSYTSSQFYKYTAKNNPEGSYITKDGIIKWKPELINIGKNTISYTISDGYYSDEEKIEIFVNDLPKIISSAKKYTNINDIYTYQLKISDKNPSEKFDYMLMKSPTNTTLDQNGLLQWHVSNSTDQINFFEIAISDQKDTIFYKFQVQINQNPQIISNKNISIKTNKLFEYQVNAVDPEGSSLYYRAIKIPTTANFDNSKGLFFWKPNKNALGVHQIIIEVKDKEGNIAYNEFELKVVKNNFNFTTISYISGAIALSTIIFFII